MAQNNDSERKKGTILEQVVSKIPSLKPFTQENVYSYYIPLAGAASYSAFSVTVFLPDLSARFFPEHSLAVANSLLFNSHIGSGLYMYNSKHLHGAPVCYRIMYSVYGTLLFNFGSVLLWAATKSLLPENNMIRAFFAVSSSFCMLTIGKEYLDFIDSKVRSS